MKLRHILVAGSIAGAGAFSAAVTPAAAAGPSAYTCTGTLATPGSVAGGTYSSLTMPAGSGCQVVGDVTVTRPVDVGTGAGLLVMAGSLTIAGPVSIATQGVLASLANSTPVHIAGPVTVGQDGAFIVGTESPGDPRVNNIAGPVTGNGASTVQIHNAVISGPVRLNGGGGNNAILDVLAPGPAFNDLEDNDIRGPVSQMGYQGVWTGVIRNVIDGPFTFSNNTESPVDEYDIGSDTIYGPATCNDNNPVPNVGHSPGSPSVVFGPTGGDQAATCTSA